MTESPSERTRLSDDVYERLQSMLIDGLIQPGQRIRIDTLSRTLGVSQTPVREALSRLEAHGVVTKTHMVGYSATPKLTLAEFEDLFEARFLFEPFCAGLAASRYRRDELEYVTQIASDMRRLYEGGQMSYGAFAKSDAELHAAIIAATGNNYFGTAFSGFHCHLQLFRLMRDSHVTDDALDEHDVLVTAIQQRNPQLASQAMSDHLTASRSRLRRAFTPAVDADRAKVGDATKRPQQRGRRKRPSGRPAADQGDDRPRPASIADSAKYRAKNRRPTQR